MQIYTCSDLQKFNLNQLVSQFGVKFGNNLYYQSRGIDNRSVEPNRIRKSLSIEETFLADIETQTECISQLKLLYPKFIKRLEDAKVSFPIKSQFIKIKFNNFQTSTAEIASKDSNMDKFIELYIQVYNSKNLPVRLLGIGVNFDTNNSSENIQLTLF